MSKHTPGPWSLWTGRPYGEHGTITDDRLGRHLAVMSGGAPETAANARLIAAAPELLEALKQIAYRTGAISLPESVALETMRGLWYTATTAIAKAEGREP